MREDNRVDFIAAWGLIVFGVLSLCWGNAPVVSLMFIGFGCYALYFSLSSALAKTKKKVLYLMESDGEKYPSLTFEAEDGKIYHTTIQFDIFNKDNIRTFKVSEFYDVVIVNGNISEIEGISKNSFERVEEK